MRRIFCYSSVLTLAYPCDKIKEKSPNFGRLEKGWIGMNKSNWFKCFCDFYSEPRIRMIKKMKGGERVLIILEQLKCVAAQERNSGIFILPSGKPYTTELLAVAVDYPPRAVKEAVDVLVDFEILSRDENGVISIEGWDEFQTLDKDALIREQTRQRVARYRDRLRNGSVTGGNATDKTKPNQTTPHLNNAEAQPPLNPPEDDANARGACNAYGDFKNVRLADEEYARFKERYPEDYLWRINELSAYIASRGDCYVNHYATLCNWASRDSKRANQQQQQPSVPPKKHERYGSFDPVEAFEQALERSFEENGG